MNRDEVMGCFLFFNQPSQSTMSSHNLPSSQNHKNENEMVDGETDFDDHQDEMAEEDEMNMISIGRDGVIILWQKEEIEEIIDDDDLPSPSTTMSSSHDQNDESEMTRKRKKMRWLIKSKQFIWRNDDHHPSSQSTMSSSVSQSTMSLSTISFSSHLNLLICGFR